MSSTDNSTVLSYGTETEQWYVNDRDRYWLTYIRRGTRETLKVRIRKEDFLELQETMSRAIHEALKKNENRCAVFSRGANDCVHARVTKRAIR